MYNYIFFDAQKVSFYLSGNTPLCGTTTLKITCNKYPVPFTILLNNKCVTAELVIRIQLNTNFICFRGIYLITLLIKVLQHTRNTSISCVTFGIRRFTMKKL